MTVTELKPKLTNAELEVEFFERLDALLCEYQEKGMTACWQVGQLEAITYQLMGGE